MSGRLSARELETWQRMQVVGEMLRREVGRGLRDGAGLSDSEFGVLARLVELGGSARPAAFARELEWDSSRLAHQLGRLERRGFLTRERSEDDGRGWVVRLTDNGRAAHRSSVGPHLRAAKRWFADALDASQIAALDDALRALMEHGTKLTVLSRQPMMGQSS